MAARGDPEPEGDGSDGVPWTFEVMPEDFELPTTRTNFTTLSVYRNLWYHGNIFYAITLVGNPAIAPAKLSPAQSLHLLSTTNLQVTCLNMMSITFPGTMLMVEHPFNAYKDDLVFWTETVIAIANTVSNSSLPDFLDSKPIAKMIFSNMLASDVPTWALDLTRVALSISTVPAESKGNPVELLFRDDLDMVNATYWVHMEQVLLLTRGEPRVHNQQHMLPVSLLQFVPLVPVLLPHQRYHSPEELVAGFHSPKIATAFRQAAYKWAAQQGGDAADEGEEIQQPRFITFVTYSTGDGKMDITNKREVMRALEEVAGEMSLSARHLAISNSTAADFLMRSMRETAILVARSSSALANLMFLPPGASVIELLPFNWVVQDMDKVYSNVTASMGDLSYCSWKAAEARFCDYGTPSEGRFSKFPAEECSDSITCVEIHRVANMIVDTAALKNTIQSCLGLEVDALRLASQPSQAEPADAVEEE
eukprot:CAMPEP_0117691214 /NCGR_PEP_ID=MMETSP0804-20121206/25580_1 /TAXON_ID=1074897 /ORGANISM="Tetraselmis astigmatica, Strain CCMP880" /LENGTH=478 /DNA_ID=CAMNT_0005504391 /DNA_START=524 /DNA_END=1961 /DNA_ORIENTATION=-